MTSPFDLTGTPQYSEFIHVSRYARWLEEENRRETWDETVDRYISFFSDRFPILKEDIEGLRSYIYRFQVMPSMRCLMTAGPALKRDEVAGYNCAFVAIDHSRSFDEILYILMNGVGVGFSVERQHINKLPDVAEEFYETDTTIVVSDSRIGWAKSFRELLSLLWIGQIPKWDLSRLRPAGARLKTFGGRSSGPEPLDNLFRFCAGTFSKAAGRKLTSIECHDLVCKIAEIVVCGGVRRSALLSLSNLSDDRMRGAKSGQWWIEHPERALANNSVCFSEKPDLSIFLKEWISLYESKSGERGLFSKQAAKKQAEKNGRRNGDLICGTNPCSEILLRSAQFCNLSEVVVRADDVLEELKEKVKVATIFGTLQSTLTGFRYLRNVWKQNTEEERLLGVSLTGIMDHSLLGDPDEPNLSKWLEELRETAVATNKEWALKLGIESSVAITCNKPSGCRPGNALTPTDRGILTLDEIFESHGNMEWGSLENTKVFQDNGLSVASKTFVNGESPLIELTLSYNVQLESTPDHKWFVKQRYEKGRLHKYVDIEKWVRADEIQPQDILDFSVCSYKGEQEASLAFVPMPEKVKHAVVKTELKQPNKMTPDLAWLIGYFYGDGCLSSCKSRIRFIDQHKVHLDKVKLLLKSIFNVDANILRASQNREAWILDKGSVWLCNWFVANGFDKSVMQVPRKIRESSRESIIAFIAGLIDSDGCISGTESAKYIITTADDAFAKQLHDVCWAVGLGTGRSLNTQGSNFQEEKHIWHLTSGAIQGGGAVALLSKYCSKASTVISWHHETAHKSRILGKVTSTCISRIAPTFDIEIPGSHWYYSGSVKSHNSVSQLVNCASGIHPRYSRYYIRTVRADKKDPLVQFMLDKGFPCEDDVTSPSNVVFSFPIKAPEAFKTVKEVSSIEQLRLWKIYHQHWCEHKPSCTVYYTDDTFLEVGDWVWSNFDVLSGVSFLPYTDHVYKQAPYQPVSKESYDELQKQMPEVDWTELRLVEKEDSTKNSHTLACSGSVCEIVDLV